MSEVQYVKTPYDLFKTVVADNEQYDSRQALANTRTLVSRLGVNIFEDEYAILYQSALWCVKNDMPLTREVLQQLILNSREELVNSKKINISKEKQEDERFSDIVNYTMSEYDAMSEEEYDYRNLKGEMNLFIQTWAEQQMQQLIYDLNLIQHEGLRVGNKLYKGRDGVNQYYKRKYEMIDSLVNERKDYLADDIDTLTMTGVEIKDKIYEEETTSDYVSKFGIPSMDNELMGLTKGEIVVVQGGSGVGKALDNNTLLETPNGQVLAKDIKVGDMLFDRLGQPTLVQGVFPQGVTERYKVTLSDGREMILSPDHLVPYINSNDEITHKELKYMIADFVDTTQSRLAKHKYRVPQNKAVYFKEQTHGVKPYDVGTKLGRYTSTTIPKLYKYDSIDNRKELLKGLMDVDGLVVQTGNRFTYTYLTHHETLAQDVNWLAQSLGYGVQLKKSTETYGVITYRVKIYTDDVIVSSHKHLERLSKLEYRSNRDKWVYITDIQQIEDGETVCFSVDNPEHLFLMNDFIVTHNTRFAIGTIGYQALMMGKNVLHISLEQKPTRVYPMYQARHIVQQIGTRARMSDSHIFKGTYDPADEGIVQESFVDLAENPNYGKLKIVGRDLKSDNFEDYLNNIYDEFPFDVVIIDYFGLIGVHSPQSRFAELAGFANTLKSACKYFKGQGFLAVVPNQLSTDVEAKLLKGDDRESKLGGAGSQDLLRGSDITVTLSETQDMESNGTIKLLVDKQRTGSRVPNLDMDVDKGRCIFVEKVDEDDDLL